MNTSAAIRLSVDIGGTFTDIVLDLPSGRHTRKILTTGERPEEAVIEGVRLVLGDAGKRFGDIAVFVHGTTLATNAVLERRGARTALIATEGFRDILEIATESRYDQYDLSIEKRPPLIPRSLRFTVPERILANGETRLPLDEHAVSQLASALRENDVESLAVCFLHSYANPAHERRTREILQELIPGLKVSISSDVCPEIREYERTSTTAANAYVLPLIDGYLARMRKAFEEQGFNGSIHLVTSSGGLTSVDTARRFPVRLIESGPAGGATFAADVAVRLGERRVLSFDMGGTTAKICLIEDYSPDRERVYEVDRAARFLKGSGLPLRIPVIDLVEIGAGGGSIAHVNALKSVAVGPESAGSEPGPACYGRGGQHPTVTDADAVLGMLDPDTFAGGTMKLDLEASRSALAADVGTPLGISAEVAAYAVHEMVCENMASAARAHAVEKGKAVSEHTLISFGGAASLHAARVAEKIGVRRIIIPSNAGVGSAVGFLKAPISYEVVRTHHAALDVLDAAEATGMLVAMAAEAKRLVAAGAQGEELREHRTAFMRYVGQGHEIPVSLPSRALVPGDHVMLRETFEAEYASLFNRSIPGAALEIMSWSVLVTTAAKTPAPQDATLRTEVVVKPDGMRSFFDGKSGTTLRIPLYHRNSMPCGASIAGPAIIAESETTIFVSATFNAYVDSGGNIVMDRKKLFGEQ